MKKRIKSPQAMLALSIILIMAGSFSAHFFQTSGYSVDVSRIEFKTDKGELSGLLYMPKGAGAGNPRPAIITTHGYLNAGEMQDAPAIEMSRRGYIVLALDMYAHGNSYLDSVPLSNPFFSFWRTSIHDAVQYMYNQPYVMKDADGNGLIAVSGHSMGGFSSTMAVFYDEQNYKALIDAGKPGIRKIHAVLTAGSDYRWSSYLGADAEAVDKSLAGRTAGAIAAEFDEFFFDESAYSTGRTMVRKNYAATETGRIFLGNPANPEKNRFYATPEGGRRIIYQPKEIHPWNHFSKTATRYQIEFYRTAFGNAAPETEIKGTGQIWRLKEYSELIALIGFFMLFIPLVQLLLKTGFFASVKTAPAAPFTGPVTGKSKTVFWLVTVFCGLFPAVYFPTLMGKIPAGMAQLKFAAGLLFAASLITAVISIARRKDESTFTGWAVTSAAAFIVFALAAGASHLFQLSPFFNEPQTNAVVFWAVFVAAVTFLVISLVYMLINKRAGMELVQYGFLVTGKNILKSFLLAVIAAAAGFVILFMINLTLKTDFRLWLTAVRAFNSDHLISALHYMPFFFLYYFSNGIALQANTNSSYLGGVKGYLTAFAINIGGLILFLAVQYGKLFITGTAAFPTVSLNSIVLIGFVVILFIATIFTKKLLEKTNNVYTGAFLNTILFTIMTVSTSTMYVNLV